MVYFLYDLIFESVPLDISISILPDLLGGRLHYSCKTFLMSLFQCKMFFCSSFQVLDSIYKECRKENPAYKMAALKCFGEIVQEYSVDRFQQISELLFPIIAPVSVFLLFPQFFKTAVSVFKRRQKSPRVVETCRSHWTYSFGSLVLTLVLTHKCFFYFLTEKRLKKSA